MTRVALVAAVIAAHCVDDFFGHDQAEECARLIACTEALVPGTAAAMNASYGPKGACWKSSEAAEACARACEQALVGLGGNPAFDSTAECRAAPATAK